MAARALAADILQARDRVVARGRARCGMCKRFGCDLEQYGQFAISAARKLSVGQYSHDSISFMLGSGPAHPGLLAPRTHNRRQKVRWWRWPECMKESQCEGVDGRTRALPRCCGIGYECGFQPAAPFTVSYTFTAREQKAPEKSIV
jgi:hypothetical protein